ncbi:DUF262 domain-containing protein [Serratia marcescens]|uniref:DUF262 domain-containing protein n=1 Tax=Serratia marcescens TaxID=615 RepID=UPI000E3DE696|nr:DUF262 domain-containing protein [Serratia marcescens]RFS94245.1 hypothetical protein CIB53_02180 [Serratia marcescens]
MNIVENIKVESRPIKWLADGLKNGTIIIDNTFQRRYVWILKDKVSLIETILMGYPIPEVYLWQNETNPETGDTTHSIVDGQQRLGAVQSYINDEFSLEKKSLDEANHKESFCGKKFSELTAEEKSSIWKYDFSVRFINNSIDIDAITKLFLRLNRTNTTLNPQELRNAEFNGEFIKLADEISRMDFWGQYALFNKSDLRRMLDIQFISTVLIFIRMGIAEETTQSAINKVYDQYNDNYPEAEQDRALFESLIEVVEKLICHNNATTEIARKKTHLYTIFNLAYFLLKTEIDKDNDYNKVANALNEWFDKYENEGSFDDDYKNMLLSEYKKLSQEGVQKKTNRLKRMEILRDYITL